ncbi:uncharacterized protein FIBRA_05082 [Fibroporia radiculosa]|uniref:Uncharacterized protein n=1 Tax=Fibroporia radiculosa TaxID=599839 RepID=J4HWX4_9APHY|nr:uncharacterized protein FIBRA_05082 [Fibroporia radiculosa]CCM02967.1 predicted protein [Fibroporia radiculosa]
MPAMAHRRRFEGSLDMVAARPELFVDLVSSPSSTDNAWSMVDSPVLGRRTNGSRLREVTNQRVDISRKIISAAPVAPLNIKKMRRRAMLKGVHLVLPASPMPPTTPGPSTSLTFTAEWDSTQRGFLFTPLGDEPSSARSVQATISPVPDDIEEESRYGDSEPEVPLADDPHPNSPMSCSSTSSVFSHSSSLFIHNRKQSTTSTAPSSICDDDAKLTLSSSTSLRSQTSHSAQSEADCVAVVLEPVELDYCLEGIDEDVLADPWQAFDSLCWESVEEPLRPVRARPVPRRVRGPRPRPDVPVDTASKILSPAEVSPSPPSALSPIPTRVPKD